jgi:hypothetical protein
MVSTEGACAAYYHFGNFRRHDGAHDAVPFKA